MSSKIVLGTAQFGLPYGVANAHGQISLEEGSKLLDLAQAEGISTLDTAIAYGDSEAVLGQLGVARWQVISKLPAVPDGNLAAPLDWVLKQLNGSRSRLAKDTLHGLLLHRPAQLAGPHGGALYQALIQARERGLVSKIGVSIYAPEELDALPRSMAFDIVQAPFNVLDQRLLTSGWASRLRQVGCEVHVRSVFLQGLLLMGAEARPKRFSSWSPTWRLWHDWLADNRLSPLEACVRYALQVADVDRVVIGVDSSAHLREILAAARGFLPPLPPEFRTTDVRLLNPSQWPQP
ncbi:MAG: aldo/keto reductase [Zoogloeaceae bacterium]|nr:aldo/keto reductase [Zoogloeaceae bacterium]